MKMLMQQFGMIGIQQPLNSLHQQEYSQFGSLLEIQQVSNRESGRPFTYPIIMSHPKTNEDILRFNQRSTQGVITHKSRRSIMVI